MLDYLYFTLIDDSVSFAYASGLQTLVSNTGSQSEKDSMTYFFMLPPFLQNYTTNIIAILVGVLIATTRTYNRLKKTDINYGV